MRRRRGGQVGEESATVQRVRQALEGYAATAPGQDVHVSVGHVLDLINPRGLWSLDPERARALRESARSPDDTQPIGPDVDPWTGCKPVTAQGEAPQ